MTHCLINRADNSGELACRTVGTSPDVSKLYTEAKREVNEVHRSQSLLVGCAAIVLKRANLY